MIKKDDKQIDLEFGTGDICVNGGRFLDENNKIVGMVAFSDQAPREIDDIGDVKAGQECKVGDFPVIMTFTKPESIDVVINQLKQAKADMLLKCDSHKAGMCSTRDYGANEYKNPCYKCCLGCSHAINMDCSFVCNIVAEHYYPEEE
ncbi:hypothetical protein MT361_05995 [Clostridium butyricum]|nr:hypothetical protein [Clostridium butyricum]MDI9208103.1 hypothetical protein [Clostridium butyricum]